MIKFIFSLISFVLAYIFLPDPLMAAEKPPLPAIKGVVLDEKKQAAGAVKRVQKKAEKPKGKPLPKVVLPSGWYEFFFPNNQKKSQRVRTERPQPQRLNPPAAMKRIVLPIKKWGEPPLVGLNGVAVKEGAKFAVGRAGIAVQNELKVKPLKARDVRRVVRGAKRGANSKAAVKTNAGGKKPIKIAVPIPSPMPKPKPITEWAREEILSARANCQKILTNVDVSVKPVKPIRHNFCGTPAPLKVSGLLKVRGQGVSLLPPATMNCAMTARMALWVEKNLQPLAIKYFKSPVKMIHNMASYSCRHRYNDPSKKISQHALANALDIAGFTLENGDTISVLKHWPEDVDEDKAAFLRKVHKSACKTFVVVLGPEANEAHKNHFHFDLGRYKVCQ